MNEKSVWFLENIDVTGIFCPQKMDNFMESHGTREYKKGQYVFLPDEAADKMYFVEEGRIKIGTYNEKGKEITKAILHNGEVFGELSAAGQEKRRDFAIALEKSILCIIDRSEIHDLLRERTGFNKFLLNLLGSRVLELEKRLENLVFKDSKTRIINFLVELNEKKGERVGYEWVVRKFITHQEIANLTATSRQTVTTVLNELRNDDLITFNRRRLLIRDLDALKAIAKR
jgi:CRP-like cAMP-binding protein